MDELIWIGKATSDGRVKIFRAKEDDAVAMAEYFKHHIYFVVKLDTSI